MSMSTKIEDLPGYTPDEINNELMQQQQMQQQQMQQQQMQQQQMQHRQEEAYDDSSIKMNIKKRVHFQENFENQNEPGGIISFLNSQINEDNLLLLFILIVASRKEVNNFLHMLPYIGEFLHTSSLLSNISKSILLLLLYILTKAYILPKIKI